MTIIQTFRNNCCMKAVRKKHRNDNNNNDNNTDREYINKKYQICSLPFETKYL